MPKPGNVTLEPWVQSSVEQLSRTTVGVDLEGVEVRQVDPGALVPLISSARDCCINSTHTEDFFQYLPYKELNAESRSSCTGIKTKQLCAPANSPANSPQSRENALAAQKPSSICPSHKPRPSMGATATPPGRGRRCPWGKEGTSTTRGKYAARPPATWGSGCKKAAG